MADALDFTDQVAIVTGAGGGLGRAYALELAGRGVRVVVNDLGTSMSGEGRSSEAAAQVVKEIEAAGGNAMADGGSVTSAEDMEETVRATLAAYGRLDILIANAGILRDTSFRKMTPEQFDAVVNVHLLGTARMTKAVWGPMWEAGYGRIIFATSTAGLFGNFGQANYAAAKMGVVGLMNTLKAEGQKNDIRINCISPFAATRMNEGYLPQDVAEAMDPRFVAAGVAFLASRDAPTGAILNAGAGVFSTSQVVETPGVIMPLGEVSGEAVAASWGEISHETGARGFASATEQSLPLLDRVRGAQA